MCGVGEKCKFKTDDKGPDVAADRRPVDPTPIVQLEVITSDGEKVTPVGPRSRESTAPRGANGDGTMYMQSETAITVPKNSSDITQTPTTSFLRALSEAMTRIPSCTSLTTGVLDSSPAPLSPHCIT